MRCLNLEEFEKCVQAYNAAVAGCPGIDPFCSRAEWILPFHSAFTPEHRARAWRSGESFLVLAEARTADGIRIFSPLESMWGFACPLVGEEAPAMLGALCEDFLEQSHVLLYGLPEDERFIRAVAAHSSASHRAFLLDPTRRCLASLDGGVEGFLTRRSYKFRVNLRKAEKEADRAGMRFTRLVGAKHAEIDGLYESVLSIEARSWKGRAGEGADRPPMRDFYRHMLERIGPAEMLRLIFAELDGEPVGYIYGACVGGRYRGLQFSFDARLAGMSLGNVLQLKMIEWLCREGVGVYDLGMEVDYKKRWAELEHRTLTLYLRPIEGSR